MRSLNIVGAVVVAVFAAGCGTESGPARSSGSLAVSTDSKYLYAADTDNGVLLVLDAQTLDKLETIKVGVRPFRVAVGKDDTIYVANRGSRSVSVISKGEWTVRGEIATGVDPVGLAVNSDGSIVYVVSATANDTAEYGTLTAVSAKSLQPLWELPVGEEPRGIAMLSDDRAVIAQYKKGEIIDVDLHNAQVLNAELGKPVYSAANKSALTTSSYDSKTTAAASPTFAPRAMTDLAATPDGKHVFATTLLSRESPIIIPPSTTVPYYQAQGPRLAGSVATPALFTFDTSGSTITPQVDDVGATVGYPTYYGGSQPQTSDKNYPQTSFAVSGVSYSPYGGGSSGSTVLQGPSAVVVDATGNWLFMVNRDTSNVSVISADKRTAKEQATQSNDYNAYYAAYYNELPSVHSTVSVGAGADGVAILGDNRTALVYSQFDHIVTRVQLNGSKTSLEVTGTSSRLADDVLTPDEVVGRKLFHDANSRAVSSVTASVACASCHLEGRDDGHTWQFPDGPRQTPTLAGRGMSKTAPYHWSGEFPTEEEFLTHTITARMGGTGLGSVQERQLNAFVDNAPVPENPYKKAELTDAQSRGAVVFQKAECGTCHSGAWLTDNTLKNVGTIVTNNTFKNPDNGLVASRGFNVPSLKGLARSAPYLHDGSAVSIKDRLLRNSGDQHGKTSALTPSEIDDLAAYLQTL